MEAQASMTTLWIPYCSVSIGRDQEVGGVAKRRMPLNLPGVAVRFISYDNVSRAGAGADHKHTTTHPPRGPPWPWRSRPSSHHVHRNGHPLARPNSLSRRPSSCQRGV